jgi:predicted peptidase
MIQGSFVVLLILCAFASLREPPALRADEDWKSMLEKKTFTDAKDNTLSYRLLKPDNYDKKTKYPLVLFLHGAGECGKDNEAQLKHGVAEFATKENRKNYPCFLVAPQCPSVRGGGWAKIDFRAKEIKLADKPSEPGRLALELVDALQKEYSIDSKRIYVTGLSMGGYGTWDAICRHPDKFAAAVPVCGGGDLNQAEKIAKLPIWVFHGAKDGAVKVERSRDMVEAIKKAGGKPKYTEYPEVGHDSWVKAYKDGDMMKWLFAQKRK